MKLSQPLLGITPKTFQTVDVNFSMGEAFSMIYSQMPIPAKHQCIIASEFICVDNGAPTNRFNSHIQKTLSSDIPKNIHLYDAISLEDSEDWDLSSSPSATISFSSFSKVGFIHFDFPYQEQIRVSLGQDGQSDNGKGFENRRIAQSYLLGNLTGRNFHLKEFDDPQPAFIGDSQPVDPTSCKVMKGITTAFTAVPFIDDSVYFSASTTCTKNKAIFPTGFFKEQTGSIFRFTDEFKGLELH